MPIQNAPLFPHWAAWAGQLTWPWARQQKHTLGYTLAIRTHLISIYLALFLLTLTDMLWINLSLTDSQFKIHSLGWGWKVKVSRNSEGRKQKVAFQLKYKAFSLPNSVLSEKPCMGRGVGTEGNSSWLSGLYQATLLLLMLECVSQVVLVLHVSRFPGRNSKNKGSEWGVQGNSYAKTTKQVPTLYHHRIKKIQVISWQDPWPSS